MEVLSPAGNMKCFKAAIEGGCDAIYIGGKNFGARAFSQNFTNEEIIEAINLAHLYDIKVYVAVNTLIYENEISDFINYIDFLHKNNVDAIILQDIGMLDLIRKTYPNLELHASTQMHIHNVEGAKLMKELGVKRIVLARETPIELIKEIKKNVDIEIEVFVHGALCVCYSGQCLMSSLIGNRSGNRGSCVQCCRKPYDLLDKNNKILNKNKYVLSMKDLNTLDYIKQLEGIVDSIKIEGRMKSEEYVYYVTNLYKKALNNHIKEEEIKNLKVLFNRKFTKGFIFNENNLINSYRPNHLGIEIGTIKNNQILLSDNINQGDGIRVLGKNKDTGLILNYIYKNKKLVDKAESKDLIKVNFNDKVYEGDLVIKTFDKKLHDDIHKLIKQNKRKKYIDIKVKAKIGEVLQIRVDDIKIKGNFKIEKSINNPISIDELIERISKIGESIYKIDSVDYDIDADIFIPIKEINELKRKMILELNNKSKIIKKYKKEEYKINLPDYKKERKISVLCNDYDLDIKDVYNEFENTKNILKLPRIIEKHKDYDRTLLVGELGSIYKYKDVISDFSLNVVNSYSVAFLHSMGVKRVTLSIELNDEQIKLLIDNYKKRYNKNPNLELIVYGKIESMVIKTNILKDYNIIEGYLKDNYNYLYDIKYHNNLTTIYHYEKRCYKELDKYYDMGVNYLRYHILDKKDFNYFQNQKFNK